MPKSLPSSKPGWRQPPTTQSAKGPWLPDETIVQDGLDKVFPEIYRVLKPNGRFYHCDMLRPTHRIVEWLYLRFLKISVALTAAAFGSSAAARNCGTYFSDAIHHFYTPDELSAVLGLCGFSKIHCRKSVWGGMVGFHAARKVVAESPSSGG